MKTQVIYQMTSLERESTRAWHRGMIGRECQCKPCRAELAAENEARKATIDALIGSIDFGQAAESAVSV